MSAAWPIRFSTIRSLLPGTRRCWAPHAGTGAEDDLGRRFVACFVAAAGDPGLPGDAEFREALRSYMRWAVADVLSYAPPGSEPPADAPVPRWSWHGLQPAGD